jgi:hypothetical protein
MSHYLETGGGATSPSAQYCPAQHRYAAWFHELDAWTEYWDIYHPETNGRFYFGDGAGEPGLLQKFLPREVRPPAFAAWTRMALGHDDASVFEREVKVPEVAAALVEVDELVGRLFAKHFGDARESQIQSDYLEAVFQFGTNSLPPATERYARIADDDPRKSSAGHHAIEGDIMWFAWALELEGAHAVLGKDEGHARRSLLLAGVATGCPADFAWRGHRRTRTEYSADEKTKALLRMRGMQWVSDFDAAAAEIHALFRIREWGDES